MARNILVLFVCNVNRMLPVSLSKLCYVLFIKCRSKSPVRCTSWDFRGNKNMLINLTPALSQHNAKYAKFSFTAIANDEILQTCNCSWKQNTLSEGF